MSLNDLMDIEDNRFGVDLYSMIETNSLTKFKIEDSYYTILNIKYDLASRYIGDFYGLLLELNIPSEMFYITTILNGLRSTNDYSGDVNIKIPNNDIISILMNKTLSDLTIPQIK